MSNNVNAMNTFLADATVFYQKVRAYHWLVTGPQFFEAHAKFEEMYTKWALHIDEVAERILTAGGTPLHTLTDMLKNGRVKEAAGNEDVKAMFGNVRDDLMALAKEANAISTAADEDNDGGTADVFDAIRTDAEKDAWMLRAALG
jgi:starvation-inducible DNA-binding protein